MKNRTLLFFLCLCAITVWVIAATLPNLTDIGTITDDDLFYVVNNPGVSPGDRKATAATVGSYVKSDLGLLDEADASALYQSTNAHLTDLSDGSLSGSKVGTGISGDNISSGTVADARIASTIARDSEITATKLDDFAAPDDNTDLNVSTSAHGLAPKLSNDPTEYLDGQGNYTVPSATSANWDSLGTTNSSLVGDAYVHSITATNSVSGPLNMNDASSGTLGVARGGSGVATVTEGALLIGQGTSAMSELDAAQGAIPYHDGTTWTNLAAGTSGYVLQSGGAGADPSWVALAGGGDFLKDGSVPMTGDFDADGNDVLDVGALDAATITTPLLVATNTLFKSAPTNEWGTASRVMATDANKQSSTAQFASSVLYNSLSDPNGTGAAVFTGSPAFTGTPTTTTPTAGDNSTKIASTAFVQTELASVSGFNFDFSGTFSISDNTPTPIYTNSVTTNQTRLLDADVVFGGATNDAAFKLKSKMSNHDETGAFSTNSNYDAMLSDSSILCWWTNQASTQAVLMVQGYENEPMYGRYRGLYYTVTNATAGGSPPAYTVYVDESWDSAGSDLTWSYVLGTEYYEDATPGLNSTSQRLFLDGIAEAGNIQLTHDFSGTPLGEFALQMLIQTTNDNTATFIRMSDGVSSSAVQVQWRSSFVRLLYYIAETADTGDVYTDATETMIWVYWKSQTAGGNDGILQIWHDDSSPYAFPGGSADAEITTGNGGAAGREMQSISLVVDNDTGIDYDELIIADALPDTGEVLEP